MAQGSKEHRMVFDVRGRRKHVVRVVYALLAVLMGLSLFLVVGSVNLGELFGSNGSGASNLAQPYEEQAEHLEVKLKKSPEDPALLMALARAQVTAGNTLLSQEPNEEDLLSANQHFKEASSTWSEYLNATKEPSAGVAQLMAPALLSLAERGSRTYPEVLSNVEAAAQAQKIVAEQRPTLNSLSTLALYTYFTGDFKSAEKAQAEASKLTKEKFEREQLDKQMKEVKERAVKFTKERKKAEAAVAAANKGNKGTPETLNSLTNPFGTGTGLGE